MNILITGCGGLIGSQAVEYFDAKSHTITGIDNNMRQTFFGPSGDVSWNIARLKRTTRQFQHHSLDIRDRDAITALFRANHFDVVIHCAAQPSHDKAKDIPLIDFDVNATGTLNLLEAARNFAPDCVFIFMSTNKVYGDAPNELPLHELPTRYDYARADDYDGIDESCRLDQSLHSIFGASKLAADVMAQEYGRYFGLKVGIFRGGCLTGPTHSGVEMHGFLSYLVKVAVTGGTYTVFGYKGKQVRDQIHSADVIRAFDAFIQRPTPGAVYNIGGGRANSASVLETIALVEEIAGVPFRWTYNAEHRLGDHICYITNLHKLQSAYPEWSIQHPLRSIVETMVHAEHARLGLTPIPARVGAPQ